MIQFWKKHKKESRGVPKKTTINSKNVKKNLFKTPKKKLRQKITKLFRFFHFLTKKSKKKVGR